MTHLIILASIGSALAGATPAGASSLKPPAPSTECLNKGAKFAKQPGKAEAKRLGELPAGSMVLTVVREENGCVTPVVVREGFGSSSDSRTERQPAATPLRR